MWAPGNGAHRDSPRPIFLHSFTRRSYHGRADGPVARLQSTAALGSRAGNAQDKYALKVPGGLAFSEFRGYESWQVISVSEIPGKVMAVIVGNPEIIKAFQAGIPANGKPLPDGVKMAKIHYTLKKLDTLPSSTVPDKQHDVDFMVKDSERFADGGGWGYAVFVYDAPADSFKPGDASDTPPQNNDAKCGVTCHTIAQKPTAFSRPISTGSESLRSVVALFESNRKRVARHPIRGSA